MVVILVSLVPSGMTITLVATGEMFLYPYVSILYVKIDDIGTFNNDRRTGCRVSVCCGIPSVNTAKITIVNRVGNDPRIIKSDRSFRSNDPLSNSRPHLTWTDDALTFFAKNHERSGATNT